MWARGLKLVHRPMHCVRFLSRPVWARGLKRVGLKVVGLLVHVAPRVGAWDVQFHGVGASCEAVRSFEQQITDRIDKDADLSDVVFEGGLQQQQVDQWVSDMQEIGCLSDDTIKAFKQSLCGHVGVGASRELPEGAEGGRYGAGEASGWIEIYRSDLHAFKDT